METYRNNDLLVQRHFRTARVKILVGGVRKLPELPKFDSATGGMMTGHLCNRTSNNLPRRAGVVVVRNRFISREVHG